MPLSDPHYSDSRPVSTIVHYTDLEENDDTADWNNLGPRTPNRDSSFVANL